ncbi:MAG: GGDEF domain-containing protein, partial [Acidimicrobiales bacterium]
MAEVLGGNSGAGLAEAAVVLGRCYHGVEPLMDHLQVFGDALATVPGLDETLLHGVVTTVLANASVGAADRLVSDSRTDQLTGIGNRRAYDEALRYALSCASRQMHPVAVAIVDLDGLKKINDQGGHLSGDEALVALARTLQESVRSEDGVFRVGGDEFAVVMPFCTSEQAQRMLSRIASSRAPRFSWGVASYPDDGASPELLTRAADVAMYRRRQLRLVRSPIGDEDHDDQRQPRRLRGALVGAAAALVVLGSSAAAAARL